MTGGQRQDEGNWVPKYSSSLYMVSSTNLVGSSYLVCIPAPFCLSSPSLMNEGLPTLGSRLFSFE